MTLSDLLYQATRIQNQVASSYIPLFLNGKKADIKLELHTDYIGYIYVDIKEDKK